MSKQMSFFDKVPSLPLNKKKNWESFRFIDLFAGIGGIRLGFESVGGKCVFSSEWDKNACKTYFANFGEYPSGDIRSEERRVGKECSIYYLQDFLVNLFP